MSMQSEFNTFLGLLGIAAQPITKQVLEKRANQESVYREADVLNTRYSIADTKEKQKALEPEFDRILAKGASQLNENDFEEFANNLGNVGKDKLYEPMKALIKEQRIARNAEAVRNFVIRGLS